MARGHGFRNTISDLSILIVGGTGLYIKVDTAYGLSLRDLFLWNAIGDGVLIARCNQAQLVNVDIDGRIDNTGVGLTVINSQVEMSGGVIEYFKTNFSVSKTVSSSCVRFFGTYFELAENQILGIFDNVTGCAMFGCNAVNATSGTTPIGVSFINGAHHNLIVGGNIGDSSAFAWTPPVKTDAASYQNRVIGMQYNGTLDSRILVDIASAVKVVTYSASMTFDMLTGTIFSITATNGTPFTINAPTNPQTGLPLTITIRNVSGGALGALTLNAVFKIGAAWTQPANGFSRSIDFYYDGTNWIERSRTPADVPN